jgi:hypothetical protein
MAKRKIKKSKLWGPNLKTQYNQFELKDKIKSH